LDVDASEGMPLFHTSHNGNTPDSKMAVENLKRIREKLKPDRMIIMVGDRNAIHGEIALLLKDYDLDFIGAVKMSQKTKSLVAAIPQDEFKPLESEKGEYLSCETTLTFTHNSRTMSARGIVVLSRKKAELDRKRREEGMKSAELLLREIRSKMNKRMYKREEFVRKKIGDVLSMKYGYLFRIDLKKSDKDGGGKLAFSYRVDEEAVRKETLLDGKYVLATTLEWSMQRVFEAYRSRYIVESRIRNMKNEIAVRPVFLHNDNRIRSLVFISILALMVYTLIEVLARRSLAPRITTRKLLLIFQKINIIEITLRRGERLQLVEDLTITQAEILGRLKLKEPESYIKEIRRSE
jgi:transposase